MRGADRAADTVGGDDKIGVLVRGERRIDFGLEFHLDAELAGALLKEPQQGRARAAAEAIAADAMSLALEVDFDVVPIGEIVSDRPVGLAVVFLERRQRFVGKHHPEPERIVGPVALEYGDLRGRPRIFHQDREIEPCGPAADDMDVHPGLHARKHLRAPIEHILSLKYIGGNARGALAGKIL